ncbi:hypothetical protein D9M70_642360 [compost metagenome]
MNVGNLVFLYITKRFEHVEARPAFGHPQLLRLPTRANDEIATTFDNVAEIAPTRITSICNYQVSRFNSETLEMFAFTLIGKLKIIKARAQRIIARM